MKKSSCSTKKYAVGGAVSKKPAVKKPVKKYAVGGFAGQVDRAVDAANAAKANADAVAALSPEARQQQLDIAAANKVSAQAKLQQSMPTTTTDRAAANAARVKAAAEQKAAAMPSAEQLAQRNMERAAAQKQMSMKMAMQREKAMARMGRGSTQRSNFDSTMPVEAKPYTGSTPTRINEPSPPNFIPGPNGERPFNKGGAVKKKPAYAYGGMAMPKKGMLLGAKPTKTTKPVMPKQKLLSGGTYAKGGVVKKGKK